MKEIDTLLLGACGLGQIVRVVHCLDQGASVNVKDTGSTGKSALNLVCSGLVIPNVELVELLLDRRADIDSLDNQGNSPLAGACSSGRRTNIISLLLRRGAAADRPNKLGKTPLSLACGVADMAAVKLLLAHKIDIEAKDVHGMTPLAHACARGDSGIVALLLSHKAKVDAADNLACTPLFHACISSRSKPPVINVLLRAKADLNARDSRGRTPLLAMCSSAGTQSEHVSTQVMALILSRGADVEARDHQGQTALLCACANGAQPRILSVLLDQGRADIEARGGKQGGKMTALMHCLTNPANLELLVSRGADLEATDSQGRTALVMAMELAAQGTGTPTIHHLACVAQLLGAGAVLSVERCSIFLDKICSSRGVHHSQLEAAGLELRRRGADIQVKDAAGNSPLHRAAHAGDDTRCSFLIRIAGASLTATNNAGHTPLEIFGQGRDGNGNNGPRKALSDLQKDWYRNQMRAARLAFEQQLRDEAWARRRDALLFLVRSGLRPTAAQAAADAAAQAASDTSSVIAPVSRATAADNRAFLLRAVLGTDALARAVVVFL